ncbi:hypothetical protein MPTK1_2g01440 [Marchantia polymorpha subsp. ruderalis]|uniref:Uncharacterized protein n=1 Tax=Marchantia polymorpha TaxID=3197 RepID=A0A2R6X995_MARPO|nr:hypothetical protein MARPO_0028s0008 [Marchantia polymorpha]BBN00715.1 hypothetical protein Mp_2g01440 [Marchantia polymorpha subsp. ruderalis]|eukprot:PTQ42681.1 hypothetical protein MARPO_0028s0008 [Marchantia polymorpha]
MKVQVTGLKVKVSQVNRPEIHHSSSIETKNQAILQKVRAMESHLWRLLVLVDNNLHPSCLGFIVQLYLQIVDQYKFY